MSEIFSFSMVDRSNLEKCLICLNFIILAEIYLMSIYFFNLFFRPWIVKITEERKQ